jgi:hypothetical protein
MVSFNTTSYNAIFFLRESLPSGVNVMNLLNHSRTHKPSALQKANARRQLQATQQPQLNITAHSVSQDSLMTTLHGVASSLLSAPFIVPLAKNSCWGRDAEM